MAVVMHYASETRQRGSIPEQLNRAVGWLSTFALAAMGALAVTMQVIVETFNSARLAVLLAFLLVLHALRYPRLILRRESTIYVCFLVYAAIALLWTDDVRLAMNTVIPAISFVLTLLFFGALAAYHNLRAVLVGTLSGVLASAAAYTALSGFPLVYPAGFSYNAVAGLYLLGLFVTLLTSCYARSKSLIIVGSIFALLLVATTSIKFNLGVLLGAMAASVINFKYVARLLRRNAIALTILVGALAYAIASNEAYVEILNRGIDRVALGIEVLQARDNVPGYSAFEDRARWQREGLKGWTENPLFGHGPEAFRDRFGSTSHSTPIDLLYNFGLIGFALFYLCLFSVLWRAALYSDVTGPSSLRAVLFGTGICYLFVSLSAPLHYNAFMAVFIAFSSTLLGEREHSNVHARNSESAR